MAAGLILLCTLSLISAGLGLCAIIWYNGVYTSFKKKSSIAVIPGALTGAAAPAIGWVSAGGSLTDYRIGVLCLCLFLWQVPHTWLLHLDYKDDYKKAGLPSLTDLFTETQLLRIIFIWIISTSVVTLFLSSGMMQTPFIGFFIFAISSWLFYWGIKLLREKDISYALVFSKINIFMFFLLVLVSLDYLIISL
jgi:protoheme IX farnesyltransferase